MKTKKKVVFDKVKEEIKALMAESKPLLQFILESNKIEGIGTSEVAVLLSLSGRRSADPHVRGMVRAIKYVLENSHRDIEISDILKIHKYITTGILHSGFVGKYRSVNVRVGLHECPPFYAVPMLMGAWSLEGVTLETINDKHYAFEKIHPFVDGNGRTGRMIWAWHRKQFGLPIKPILEDYPGDSFNSRRKAYYDAISNYKKEYRDG